MNFRMDINERRRIQELLDHGTELKEIAIILNRSYPAITVEIKRNGGKRLYNAEKAQENYENTKRNSNAPMEQLRDRVDILEKKLQALIDQSTFSLPS